MTTGPDSRTHRPSAARRALRAVTRPVAGDVAGGRVAAHVAGSKAARVYLLVVLALLVWVAADSAFVHRQDASLAAVVPMLATLPWGLAVALLPEGATAGYYPAIAAAALVNAALLSRIGRSRG